MLICLTLLLFSKLCYTMHLAIFDLDHTLLRGDSDKLWGDYLISIHKVDPVTYKQKNDHFFAQ